MAMKKLLLLMAFIILLFFPNYVRSIPIPIGSVLKRVEAAALKYLLKQAGKKAVKEAVKEGRDYFLDQLYSSTTKTIYSNVTFSYDFGLFNMGVYIGDASNRWNLTSIDTTSKFLWLRCGCSSSGTEMYNSLYDSSGFSFSTNVYFDVFGDTTSKNYWMSYGCECDAHGVLNTTGILALAGLNRVSSILASMPDKRFSYCLPDLDSNGFIFFNYPSTVNEKVPHTTILDVPFYGFTDLYVLELESITVDSSVSTPSNLVNHTVIDTVIPFSYFASDIYQTLTSALDSSMKSLQKADSVQIGSYNQPCYFLTDEGLPPTPNVNFTFKGQAVLELDNVNLLYFYNESVVCFAFFGLPQGNGFNLIGSYQLINHLVEHDIDKMQVGFAKYDNCSLSYQKSAESAALGNSAALLHLLAFTFIAIMVFAY